MLTPVQTLARPQRRNRREIHRTRRPLRNPAPLAGRQLLPRLRYPLAPAASTPRQEVAHPRLRHRPDPRRWGLRPRRCPPRRRQHRLRRRRRRLRRLLQLRPPRPIRGAVLDAPTHHRRAPATATATTSMPVSRSARAITTAHARRTVSGITTL